MSNELDTLGRESARALVALVEREADTESALQTLRESDSTVEQDGPRRRRRPMLIVALAAAAILAGSIVAVTRSTNDQNAPVDTVRDDTSTSVAPPSTPDAAPPTINVTGPFEVESRVSAPAVTEVVSPRFDGLPALDAWPLDDLTVGLVLEEECDGCGPRAPLAVVDSTGRIVIAENGASRFNARDVDIGANLPYPDGTRVTAMTIGPGDIVYATLEASGLPRTGSGQLVAYRAEEMVHGMLRPLVNVEIQLPTYELYIDGEQVVRQATCTGCAAPAQERYSQVVPDPTPRPSIVGDPTLRVAGTTTNHAVLQTEIVGDPPTEVAVVVARDGSYRVIALPESAHNGAWTVDARGIVVIDIDDVAHTWRLVRIPLES